MKITKQFDEETRRIAEELGKPRSAMIHDLVLSIILSQSEYFACCPICDQALFDPVEVPITGGIQKQTCKEGHEHYYDFHQNRFLKLDEACYKCKYCQGLQTANEPFCQNCDRENWEVKDTEGNPVLFNPEGLVIA